MESFEFACSGVELARVLGNAREFAEPADLYGPALTSVWLELRRDAGVVSASATDRFTAYVAAFAADGFTDSTVGLPPAGDWAGAAPDIVAGLSPGAVKALVTAGRNARTGVVKVTVADGAVTVEGGASRVSATVEPDASQPKLHKIVEQVLAAPPGERVPVGLNLAKLAQVTACKPAPRGPGRTQARGPAVRAEFRFGGDRDPVAAFMPGAVALIMPMKPEQS